MAPFLRSIALTMIVTVVVAGLWAALGALEIEAWWMASAAGDWPRAVAASAAVVMLSVVTMAVIRRPTEAWPTSTPLTLLILPTLMLVGLAALLGAFVGLIMLVPDHYSQFDYQPTLAGVLLWWVEAGAVFLPAVALAEAFIVGLRTEPLGRSVRRVVALVVSAHLAWLVLELVAWAVQ